MTLDDWKSQFEKAIIAKLDGIDTEKELKILDVGIFPWHSSLELSALYVDDESSDNCYEDDIASWPNYDFSSQDDWSEAEGLGKAMGTDYEADTASKEAYFCAAAEVMQRATITTALETKSLASDFRVTVLDPDDPGTNYMPEPPSVSPAAQPPSKCSSDVTSDYLLWTHRAKGPDTDATIANTELLWGVKRPRGQRWDAVWPNGLTAEITSRSIPTDAFMSGADWFVSGRLAAMLKEHVEDCENTFELLPIEVLKNGEQLQYSILHIFRSIDVLDREQSEFALDDNVIDGVSKIVLDATKVPAQCNLFRLDSWEPIIFLRQELAHRLVDAGISGIGFESPAEWF